MHTGMNLYNAPSKDSVAELREAINEILQSGVEQKTMRTALHVLKDGVQTGPFTVSDCSIYGDNHQAGTTGEENDDDD